MALNYVWIAFFVIAFIVALIKLIFLGDTEIFSLVINGIFDSAKTGAELSLGLVGIMTFWLGIMKVGENAGMITSITRGCFRENMETRLEALDLIKLSIYLRR